MDMIAHDTNSTSVEPAPQRRAGRPRKTEQHDPTRTLNIDDTALEALDRFDELNRWGYGPTTAEVIEQASKAACDFIMARFDGAMTRPKKLENEA